MTETKATYDRVMLKISGEALMGDQGFGLNPPTVERIAREVHDGFRRAPVDQTRGKSGTEQHRKPRPAGEFRAVMIAADTARSQRVKS